jgi:catechol 2,3-dioxygenase-like lactoylglutathione lyase family enzyme
MQQHWPQGLPVVQFRIARPTHQLERVVAFYRDGLGLSIIYSYTDDADYDGVMFGLPNRTYNLEITQHKGDGPCPIPPPDNLLVFYIPDQAAIDALVARLGAMGYDPVPPRNPYWAKKGITVVDPDGWHVVLMNSHGFREDVE